MPKLRRRRKAAKSAPKAEKKLEKGGFSSELVAVEVIAVRRLAEKGITVLRCLHLF